MNGRWCRSNRPVRRDHQGPAAVPHGGQDVPDLAPGPGVHARRRFVQQDEVRATQQGHAHTQLSLVAATGQYGQV